MWGTDYPLITHSESLSQIADFDLKPEARQALLHDTAAKVFKLPELAALALRGDLDLVRVVTHVAPLEGVNEALDRLRRGEGARTILVLDEALAGRSAAAA